MVLDTTNNYLWAAINIARSGTEWRVGMLRCSFGSGSLTYSNTNVKLGSNYYGQGNTGYQYYVAPEALSWDSTHGKVAGLGTSFR
jgi:hypothetical protein